MMRFPIVIRIPVPAHDARDFRVLLALLLLAGSGIPTCVLAWLTTTLVAQKSLSPWPLAYALYGYIGLQFAVVTGISCVLGRRRSAFSLGKDGARFENEGDDAAAPLSGGGNGLA